MLLAAAAAAAEPNEYIETPGGERGEVQVELRSGTSRERDGTRRTAHAVSAGYGLTGRWFSEVVAAFEREPGGGQELEGVEWENKFLLSEPGAGAPGVGLLLEVERSRDRREGYALRGGPMLQWNARAWQFNLNPLWSRRLRTGTDERTAFAYQFQARHPMHPGFEFGLQAFGDVGPWDDWLPRAQQSHRVGPAAFGTLDFERGEQVLYDAALLLGTGGAAPRTTLRVQLEFEF